MSNFNNWIPATTPPKKDGYYMVKFYFPYRHPTDRIKICYRNFIDGKWDAPYYDNPNEDSVLDAWQEYER